jgi:hypothetical protein
LRNPLLSRVPLALLMTCIVCLLAAGLSGQEQASPSSRVSVVDDWTMHHVVYTRFGPMDRMQAIQRDPRALFAWERLGMLARSRSASIAPPHLPLAGLAGNHVDWAIDLGAAGTAATMYPAKFTFDITAAPSCTNDFVIYPVNTPGSSTQANLVAFNNLYRGTGSGGTGVCNTAGSPDDEGTVATVLWSYNIDAIGGAVTISPVISWDEPGEPVLGTKVAFVESATGSPAHFHVLAWRNGDGQDTTQTRGLQNTRTPATINTFVATSPIPGSGTATDLALGATGTDTRSSPFVDYPNDTAYVGNDVGVLYRIKDVFCPSYNQDAGCTAGSAPSLDSTWGTGGAVTVCSGMLTGAVEDFVTNNVFVGCSDGKLYGFNSVGAPLSPASVTVGNGSSPFGGVVDPPIVDGANGLVYASSGSNGSNPVLVQTNTTFSTFTGESGNTNTATLGTVPTGAAAANYGTGLHAPAFNAFYLYSAISSNWVILSCGYNAAGTNVYLFDIGFNVAMDGTREMKTGTPPAANQVELFPRVDQCSPLTEFLNSPGLPLPPTDWLFLSHTAVGYVRNYNITTITNTGFPGGYTYTGNVAEPGGTSGIIVDNESTEAQASSIYFSTLGPNVCGITGNGRCAVKLTQSGLE